MTPNKDEFVRFRVTKAERLWVERLAEKDGRKISEFMRELIRAELKRQELPPPSLAG